MITDSTQVNTEAGLQAHATFPMTENDILGGVKISDEVYWGVHILRAIENFPITGNAIDQFFEFVQGFGYVKMAAARANRRLGSPRAPQGGSDRAGLHGDRRRTPP
jgi:hypothetical protein